MYNNIGSKIKTLAKVLGLLLLVVGVIAGIYLLADGRSRNDSLGGILLASGVLGYICSWPLYGFGELVENIQKLTDLQIKNNKEQE